MLSASLGAKFIERHITLSNASIGFDHGISMEPHEFKKLALELRSQNQMMGIKEELLKAELSAREKLSLWCVFKKRYQKRR